jgi:hypothetical protein
MNKYKLIDRTTPPRDIPDFDDYNFYCIPVVYELTRDRYFELINDSIRLDFMSKTVKDVLEPNGRLQLIFSRCECNKDITLRQSIDEHINIYNDLVNEKLIEPYED